MKSSISDRQNKRQGQNDLASPSSLDLQLKRTSVIHARTTFQPSNFKPSTSPSKISKNLSIELYYYSAKIARAQKNIKATAFSSGIGAHPPSASQSSRSP